MSSKQTLNKIRKMDWEDADKLISEMNSQEKSQIALEITKGYVKARTELYSKSSPEEKKK